MDRKAEHSLLQFTNVGALVAFLGLARNGAGGRGVGSLDGLGGRLLGLRTGLGSRGSHFDGVVCEATEVEVLPTWLMCRLWPNRALAGLARVDDEERWELVGWDRAG